MYRCQITNKISKVGEPLNKIVALTRERVYTKCVRDEETNKWQEVVSGHGWEIVKELSCSREGVELWDSWQP